MQKNDHTGMIHNESGIFEQMTMHLSAMLLRTEYGAYEHVRKIMTDHRLRFDPDRFTGTKVVPNMMKINITRWGTHFFR